jgi:hypothetical protein
MQRLLQIPIREKGSNVRYNQRRREKRAAQSKTSLSSQVSMRDLHEPASVLGDDDEDRVNLTLLQIPKREMDPMLDITREGKSEKNLIAFYFNSTKSC